MRLDTRVIRNLSFVAMLATIPLAPSEVVAGSQYCGEYSCSSLCYGQGGYLAFQNCDAQSCSGDGCQGGGSNCAIMCTWCQVGGWVCS
jgi:hypothetical protein